MTGYEMKKYIETSIGFFWKESFGQIYPSLKSLESEGLVDSNREDSGAKARNVYRITDTGRKVLKDWLEGETERSSTRNELLLKLFFARNMDKENLLSQLEKSKQNLLEEKRIYESLFLEMERDCKDHPDKLYWHFTLDYGLRNIQMNLEWIESTYEKVSSLDSISSEEPS
jgi:DNA-binding PadR family transcriptional regulator